MILQPEEILDKTFSEEPTNEALAAATECIICIPACLALLDWLRT